MMRRKEKKLYGYFSAACDHMYHDKHGKRPKKQLNGVASGRNLRGYTPIFFSTPILEVMTVKVKSTVFMLIAAAISGMVGESIERGLNSWDEKRTAKKKVAAEQAENTEEALAELEKLEEENP